ncbi:DUF87 domain-containing protein [Thioclava sp. BHET1]|nr:DUF87 domain-containing protein [Thioclava sp. BHET1]
MSTGRCGTLTTSKKTFAETLNWYGLVAPGVVLCKDGSFLAGWHLTGIDTESIEPEAILAQADALARNVTAFNNGETFWIDLARRPLRDYRSTEMDFPPGALRVLEREREEWFQSHSAGNFANGLTLVYQSAPSTAPDLFDGIKAFETSCRTIEDRFRPMFELERLRAAEEPVGIDGDIALRDSMVGRLASAISGRFRKVNIPKIPVFLDVIFAPEWVHKDPMKLPRVSGRPAAFIAIDGYPQMSNPEMLSCLERLDMEYSWTTRFTPLSSNRARSEIKKRQNAWGQAKSTLQSQLAVGGRGVINTFAAEMQAEAHQAHEDAEAGLTRYGIYTTTVSLFGEFGDEEETVRFRASSLVEMLGGLGYSARIETFNALDAFVGTLPGHRHHNARHAIVSAQNFAHLIPIKTIWSGEPLNPSPLFPAKSPALVRARSQTGEPYFFNLHSGDNGHTLIFGPTGAGKSVLLGLLASSFMKYPGAQVFVFDRNNSMKALCHAIGGRHYTLGEDGNGTGLAPLKAASRLGRDWAESWLTALVEFEGVTITPEVKREIRSGLAASMDLDGEALTNFQNLVQNEAVREAIAPWLEGGSRQGLLNAESDEIELAPFTVFETAQLFEQHQSAGILTLDYLFRMIETRLTGAPSIIVLDEGWAFLGHEFFATRLKKWLRELRKTNTSVVLATQFVSDAVNGNLADVLLSSCPTRIFLPDPSAKSTLASQWYSSLQLSPQQIDLLAAMTPKRDYFVVKPDGTRVVNFAMQPKMIALLGATAIEDSQLAATMAASGDPDWWRSFIDTRLQKGRAHA